MSNNERQQASLERLYKSNPMLASNVDSMRRKYPDLMALEGSRREVVILRALAAEVNAGNIHGSEYLNEQMKRYTLRYRI